MAYTKTQWANNQAPALDADHLNHIEQGIKDAHDGLDEKADATDIPTKVSDLDNDAGYTSNTGTITGITMNGASKGTSGNVDLGTVLTEHQDITGKQDTLVSGTNIKTINGSSLLGPGNIVIEGGGGGGSENIAAEYSAASTYAVGDYCIYDGQLYRCTTAITTAEAWTAAHWTMATVGGELTDLKGDIPQNVSDLTNDSGFITAETDPVYSASAASGITSSDISNWNSKQAALVSGTNIKTVNSTSLLGSGNVAVQPTLVSGTNIKTVNSTSLLGSGNIAVQSVISAVTVTISVADWSATTTCTKSVSGVTASNNVVVTPDPASISDWQSAGVYCSAQGSGTLTFTCSSTPSASLTVNVLVIS